MPPFVIFSDATLHDMARLKPRTRPEMLAVSGVGQSKFEKYGEAFMDVTRAAAATGRPPVASSRPRPETPLRDAAGKSYSDTTRRTLELYREGLDLPEIAAKRNLGLATVVSHAAELVGRGEIDDVARWVDELTMQRIRRANGPGPIAKIAPLKEELGETVSFEQLHLARAWINRELGK